MYTEFTVSNILSPFRIFEQLGLALKNFTVLNILFTFRIFEQLALALKNSCSVIFHCIEIFLSFRIFEQLALILKTELALKIFKPGETAATPRPPPRAPMFKTKSAKSTVIPLLTLGGQSVNLLTNTNIWGLYKILSYQMTKIFRDNCDINTVQQTSCKVLLPDIRTQ